MEAPKILALDAAGNPLRWIDYDKAAYWMSKNRLAWTPAGASKLLRGGVNAATMQQSTLDLPTIFAVKGKGVGKASQFRPRLTKRDLHRRDGNMCCYCNQKFPDSQLTMDHVYPVSLSGPTIWENLVSACFPCNNEKANRTPEQAKMKMHFKPYVPNRAQFLYFTNNDKSECQKTYLENFMNKNGKQEPDHSVGR